MNIVHVHVCAYKDENPAFPVEAQSLHEDHALSLR